MQHLRLFIAADLGVRGTVKMNRFSCFDGDDGLSSFIESCDIIPKLSDSRYVFVTAGGTRLSGDMVLIYCTDGRLIVTINDTVYDCSAGDVIIIPQYVFYKIDIPGDDSHKYFSLHFKLDDIVKQKQLISLIGDVSTHIGIDTELIFLFERLEREITDQKAGSRAVIKSLVIYILIKIIHLSENGSMRKGITSRSPGRSMAVMERCVRYITGKKGMLTVSDLCREMFFSTSYIRKLFNGTLGISPSRFIRIIRLREAQNMLLSTNLHISEISSALGYSSPYHFSGEFTRCCGKSPTAYRKSGAI
jgi:AraC-like DNA-binding protein